MAGVFIKPGDHTPLMDSEGVAVTKGFPNTGWGGVVQRGDGMLFFSVHRVRRGVDCGAGGRSIRGANADRISWIGGGCTTSIFCSVGS